jgi:ribonuclease T1
MRAAAAALALVCSAVFAFSGNVQLAELPVEARETVALIQAGGPFPYARDGAVFANRQRQLPPHERGYYREYTVKSPASRGRGGRRIVAGRDREYYYTDDHYRSFRRIIVP